MPLEYVQVAKGHQAQSLKPQWRGLEGLLDVEIVGVFGQAVQWPVPASQSHMSLDTTLVWAYNHKQDSDLQEVNTDMQTSDPYQ
ncbi:unnamed protein product [Nesidiocoris tenuis]|uniref:Uncharacterized protein n=1 Tax=Nesidiocoris tenuis TaxID=355587 RepID=A0A6H5GR78_9HEMI|nr:unnamed protein product [Nesidiocoris tenuis]